jgi:hypothetical protein
MQSNIVEKPDAAAADKKGNNSPSGAAPNASMASVSPGKSDTTKIDNTSPSSGGQSLNKSLYIFSNIFEKQQDIKNCPFIFEKHNLKKRKTNEEYGNIKMESFLVRPRKKSILNKAPIQLNDINHDMENIKVSNDKQKQDGDKDKPNFK